MKNALLVSLILMFANTVFAIGLPGDMTGPVCGFLSSKKRGTHDYTSHPRITKIGEILDGALILNSKKFSDFTVQENERFTVYESRKDDFSVEILTPKPFRLFYIISIKHDDGTFSAYTIKLEKKERLTP